MLQAILLAALSGSAPVREPAIEPAEPLRAVSAARLGITVIAPVSGCPAPGAVVDQLLRLPARDPHDPSPVRAYVSDLGDRFHVELAGRAGTAKVYPDRARRCEERARAAALYILLAPGPPPPWHRGLHIDLDAAAVLAGGLPAPLSGGGALRLTVGTARLGGALGVGVHAPATALVAERAVSLLRLPLDVSVRGALRRGRVEGAAEAGLLVSVVGLTQAYGLHGPGAWAAAPGLRLGLHLRVWLHGRLALSTGFSLEWTPRPIEVAFDYPPGVRGALPALFLGGTAGLLWRVR